MAQMHKSITADRVIQMVMADNCEGICKHCGQDQSGLEPDARNVECESCGKRKVFGAQELLFAFPL